MQQRNVLMNYLLSEYQADILPLVAKVLVNMSKTEREQLTRANNFFVDCIF